MRALVTGAGGFIGSHLTESLVTRGYSVRALLHYNGRVQRGALDDLSPEVLASVEAVQGDVCDPFMVQELVRGCDVVFHLAALIAIPYSYQAPASYLAVNGSGTLNVLEACKGQMVPRLLVVSTSEVYGTARYTPIDEEHPLQGQSPYSASKIAAEKLAQSYFCSFDLPVTIVRPFNTYGPRQSARAVVPTIAAQIAAGLPELRLGSLWPERDLTYVEDTAAGLIALGECERAVGETVNLGSGRTISVGELARQFLAVAGRDVPIVSLEERTRPQRSEVGLLLADARKANQLTGWEPKVPLREGLARTLKFAQTHPERFRPGDYQH